MLEMSAQRSRINPSDPFSFERVSSGKRYLKGN